MAFWRKGEAAAEGSIVWRTEKRRIGDLVEWDKNPRRLTEKQEADLATSLLKFGYVEEIVVNADGRSIIGGHMRRKVAIARELLSPDAMVDVRIPSRPLSEDEGIELAIRLNKNTGEWDYDLLANDFDVDALREWGFGDDDFGLGFAKKIDADADEVVEEPPVVTSVHGDVWLLGKHRLICGDATDAETVSRVLAGAKPVLMVTDPPYGVDYDPLWREHSGIGNLGRARARDAVVNDDRSDWREAWALFPGDVMYVWHGGLQAASVHESIVASGFNIRAQIVWAKQLAPISRGAYHWRHECCWYAVRHGRTADWHGDRKQTTVWEIPNLHPLSGKKGPEDDRSFHGTQKPVECMKRPIEHQSAPGSAVYDPFVGAGTTIIAAEMTSRACFAVELTPNYVDVSVLRWQKFTGQQATLAGDGRTFEEIRASRGAMPPSPPPPAP
jgi:DNA modification methylase